MFQWFRFSVIAGILAAHPLRGGRAAPHEPSPPGVDREAIARRSRPRREKRAPTREAGAIRWPRPFTCPTSSPGTSHALGSPAGMACVWPARSRLWVSWLSFVARASRSPGGYQLWPSVCGLWLAPSRTATSS